MNKIMAFMSVAIIATFMIAGIVACLHFAPIITICALIYMPLRREIVKKKLEKNE